MTTQPHPLTRAEWNEIGAIAAVRQSWGVEDVEKFADFAADNIYGVKFNFHSGSPTVARVAKDTIIELVYDPEQRKTGLAVSRHGGLWNIEQEVRIHTGETLIPYLPGNNLIANDCVLLPSKPEHHGETSHGRRRRR